MEVSLQSFLKFSTLIEACDQLQFPVALPSVPTEQEAGCAPRAYVDAMDSRLINLLPVREVEA